MQFFRFIVAGGINTAVTYAIYLLLVPFLGYLVAYSFAYLTGIVFSYWLNSAIVFRRRMTWAGLARFPLVYVVQYALTALLLSISVDVLGIGKELSLLAALCVTTPITFVISRTIIVGRRK